MKANPYLNFKGNTEEAFNFYRSVFGGEFAAVMRFRDFKDDSMQVPERERDRIAHIALPIGDAMLMGTDVLEGWPKPLTFGTNFYITIEPDTAADATRIFNALAEGGEVEMALQATEWAELYGSLRDRFGVQWMLSYGEGAV